ncbi:NAD(P)-dependent alcohol dehydrogenase [Acidipropionibacterium virtanenii]|uniref:D-xylulose reductase n=1 Tax=Acidipropionibacterium virtanenii TaxID=2057246 RepID=A0A344UXP9_9ACTN|nr:NAD(P)-dependent alcohol dehydrogenase [Acidipropionibacterium virtanenii]AXE40047.1 D-xylulose reductase [Acidipropionibacterium virtanenii]
MKAVVLEKKNELTVREVPDPGRPGEGELRIAPRSVGICGSDVHYVENGRIGKFVVEKPMVLGHEASGVVTEVGPGVEGFAVGDRVAMEPGIPDLSSKASRLGMYNVDPAVRFWATPPVDGCLCEAVVHPADFTYHLPDELSFGEGALLEPMAVAVHAVEKGGVKPGDTVAVSGAGTVGLLTACIALACGAGKVYISDVAVAKLDTAGQIPGLRTVNLQQEVLSQAVADETDGWGADVVLEASGAMSAYKDLWKVGAPGNTTVLVGMPAGEVPVDVVELQSRETQVETVFRYANDYPRAIELAASGRVDLSRFITETFRMEDAVRVFQRAAESRPTDLKLQFDLS